MIFLINDITYKTYEAIKASYDEGIRDFHFEIDSQGGSLDAAFRIYDLLRGDADCTVSANVDQLCASAATVLLLAAPLEKRSATKHSVFLCHSPLMSFSGDVNLQSVEQLHGTIESAYNELKNLYLERTNSADVIDSYMKSEKEFYATEAVRLGFISHVNELYNNSNTKMSKIKNLIASILNQLKNEKFKTKDQVEFEALSLEVGAPVEGLTDGVYELEDGTVITVEQGIIVDIIPPVEDPADAPEVENEDPVDEPADAPADPEVEKTKEEVVETAVAAAEEVAEATTEEEIRQIIEEAISELKEEIINKYKPMAEAVNALGGLERLKSLKNAQPDKKNFQASRKKEAKTSLEVLLAKVNKK